MMKRASTGHESYEHVLMCLICRNLFDDHDHQPKFLPCHHTFCKDCLRQYVAQLGDEIECPSCRKLATIPAAGVAALQTNFYAKYIQSLVYGCVGNSAGWVSDCSRHPGRRLLHFCKDCSMSICDVCLQELGCARHRCDLLTAVMERYRCDVDAAFSDANALIESKKTELERLLRVLAAEKDDALIRIESTFEQHAHALTRRATLLKNKVIDVYNEHAARLDADLEEVSTGLTCVVSLKEHYEPMISRGDFTDAGKGIAEMRDVRGNLSERIRPYVNRILFEEKHGVDGFRSCVKDLGRVVSKAGELPLEKLFEDSVEERTPLRGDGKCIDCPDLGTADRLGVVKEGSGTIEPLLSSSAASRSPGLADHSSASFKTEVSVNIRNKLPCTGDVLKITEGNCQPNNNETLCFKGTSMKELRAADDVTDCRFDGCIVLKSGEKLSNATFSVPIVASLGEDSLKEMSTKHHQASAVVTDCRFEGSVVPKSNEKSLTATFAITAVSNRGDGGISPKEMSTKQHQASSVVTNSKFEDSVVPKPNEKLLNTTFCIPYPVASQGEDGNPTSFSAPSILGQADFPKLHTAAITTKCSGDNSCEPSNSEPLPQVTLTLNLDNLRAVSIRSENCSLANTTSSASDAVLCSSARSSSSAESDDTISAESESRTARSRCVAHKSYDEPRLRLELGYETSDAEDASASPSRQMSRSDFWLMMSSSVESNLSEHDLIVAELSGEQTSL